MTYEPYEIRLGLLEDEIRDLKFEVKQLKAKQEHVDKNAVFYSRADSKSRTEHYGLDGE